MEFSPCFSGKIKNGILTGPKGQFKIPYTLQKTLSKGFELATSTCGLRWTTLAGPRHTGTTAPHHLAKRNRTDAPYNHSWNSSFFKSLFSKCAQFSGRYLLLWENADADIHRFLATCKRENAAYSNNIPKQKEIWQIVRWCRNFHRYSAMMLVGARLRHISTTKWGTRQYMTTCKLCEGDVR